MDTCAFTHEHPRTRRCTIHPRTLTPTLTKNTTNQCIFRTQLDQSRKCLYLLSRISGCAILNLCWSTKEWVVAALGRRWTWRLWRAPTNTTAEVPRTLHEPAHAMRCVIAFHVCFSRQTARDTSSYHPCTELHDQVTLHGSSTMFMPSQPPCFFF